MTAVRDADPGQARSAPALLRDRRFGPFFFGNLTSNVGLWFHNLAAAIVIFDMTGSATWVGALVALQYGPTLLLSAWVGGLSDRLDRRRMLLVAQLVSFVAGAALAVWTVIGLSGPLPILGLTLIIGIAWAFSTPPMQALIPSLVPDPDLDQAIALNSVTFNLARALGPALGAATLAALGPATAFGVNAVSYLALAVALLFVHPRQLSRPGGGDSSLREAVRYVRGDPTTGLMLVAVAALSFGADPVNTLAPALAATLGGGDATVGLLVSAFGTGAFAVALVAGKVRARLGQEASGTIGLAVLALGMAVLAGAPVIGVALAGLAAAGVGFLISVTSLTTRITQRAPDELRGRVMAAWSVAFLGTRPIAGLIDGFVADLSSPRVATLLAAAFAAAGGLLLWRVQARLDATAAEHRG